MLDQLVQWQVKQIRVAATVDQHLADVGVDLLHRVDVQPVARHGRRLLVLDQHAGEALRIALGLCNHARLVAFGFFTQPRGRALRFRDHVVGVGLAFVLEPLAIGARLEGVVEGRLHLLWRLHVLHVHVDDENAGVQAVSLGLDRFDQFVGDRVALLVQNRIHRALADDLTHSGFGRLHDGIVGVAVLEQVRPRVLQAVLNGESDVDDVLVLRQHRRITQTRRLHDRVATDLYRAELGDRYRLVRLERVWHAPLETGIRGVAVLAERGHHRLLAFLHDEEAAAEPQQRGHTSDQSNADSSTLHVGLEVAAIAGCWRSGSTALAAEHAAQLLVEITPQFIEIGRPFPLVQERG